MIIIALRILDKQEIYMPADSLTIVYDNRDVRVPANTDGWTQKVDSLKQVAQPLMPWIKKNEQKAYDEAYKDRMSLGAHEGFEVVTGMGWVSAGLGFIAVCISLEWKVKPKISGMMVLGGLILSQIWRIGRLFEARANGAQARDAAPLDVQAKATTDLVHQRNANTEALGKINNQMNALAQTTTADEELAAKTVAKELNKKANVAAEKIIETDKALNDKIDHIGKIITDAKILKLREAVQ